MKRFTLGDLQRTLAECAGEGAQAGRNGNPLDHTFEELGYDSLALMAATSKIERELNVSLPEDEVDFTTTLRDYLEFVNGAVAGQPRDPR